MVSQPGIGPTQPPTYAQCTSDAPCDRATEAARARPNGPAIAPATRRTDAPSCRREVSTTWQSPTTVAVPTILSPAESDATRPQPFWLDSRAACSAAARRRSPPKEPAWHWAANSSPTTFEAAASRGLIRLFWSPTQRNDGISVNTAPFTYRPGAHIMLPQPREEVAASQRRPRHRLRRQLSWLRRLHRTPCPSELVS